ncbi:MAG: hypothetical protein ACI4M9_02590 [Succinivibrio sp.]
MSVRNLLVGTTLLLAIFSTGHARPSGTDAPTYGMSRLQKAAYFRALRAKELQHKRDVIEYQTVTRYKGRYKASIFFDAEFIDIPGVYMWVPDTYTAAALIPVVKTEDETVTVNLEKEESDIRLQINYLKPKVPYHKNSFCSEKITVYTKSIDLKMIGDAQIIDGSYSSVCKIFYQNLNENTYHYDYTELFDDGTVITFNATRYWEFRLGELLDNAVKNPFSWHLRKAVNHAKGIYTSNEIYIERSKDNTEE